MPCVCRGGVLVACGVCVYEGVCTPCGVCLCAFV